MSDNSESGYTPPDVALLGDDHIKAYLETDGEMGHKWNGATCLVLTVKGRKTGLDRAYALIYDVDDSGNEPRYVVVASMGGAPMHPQWYRNLTANPNVTAQIKGDRFAARARTAEGDERERLWTLMNRNWPNYDVYATRTDRVIPIVVLERI
jgi:deazaflavin-dependent oxidoreductase (nitroreductase family)